MTPAAQAWIERFSAVRGATEALAEPLSAEDQLLQSMPSASPTKWHRAHTTWFFEEFVLGPRGHAPERPEYRFLFNSYYDAVGPRHPRPARGLLSRPSAAEVATYRRAVDGRMIELLGRLDEAELQELRPLLALGLAHEEQHQELILTDILHALFQSPLRPAYRQETARPGPAKSPVDEPPPLRFIPYEGGLVSVGDDGAQGFSFDNEGPRHKAWLEPFALASRPITNDEVRAFVEAGGYREPRLWLSEGFELVRRLELQAPLYVELEGRAIRGFSLDGMVDLDPAAPAAHLSYYEADAIARFLGARLPTEVEWEVAAQRHRADEGNFRESRALRTARPSPAAEPAALFGDVWEWTSSAYAPYAGFEPSEGAVGEYNGKFMVNQWVLRGGSCFTPRGHVRASYRNFWHPDTRFQVAGARLARGTK